MPFGLKNAGATYQRLMDKAFESQVGRNIEVYVDDLVVKSHTEAEMVRDIEETFRTLRKVNMKLNKKMLIRVSRRSIPRLVLKVVLLCLTKRTMYHGRLVFSDDELSDKELKQIKADDQAIQTILFGLPKDIYATVDREEGQVVQRMRKKQTLSREDCQQSEVSKQFVARMESTCYHRSSDQGFSDADYAGCKDTFKSTSGEAQFLGEKLVSWSSKKQDYTALSTAEEEYVPLSA
nr:reverse transcriptase domain-containing protein [Tanacetum cinerariifolium]